MAWVGRFGDFAKYGQPNVPMTKTVPPRHTQGRQNYGSNNYVHNEYDNPCLPQVEGATPIANISSTMQTVSIVGVVIGREGPRAIVSKKGSGQERHLLCLTVRDGPMSFVNVTCWGGEEYTSFLHSITAIGEVVEIKGAQVQEKSNPADERFKPWTPCSCQLNVSETNGSVSPYTDSGWDMFAQLSHVPTRDGNDYYALEDINTNGINLQGQHVNILAIVKKIWPVRQITTKTGKKTSKVDVVLCDESCMVFNLTLWDSFVELAEKWFPMETVIFASDIKIVYNDFRSSMAASSDSKSIFTMSPDTGESHRLLNLAKTQHTFTSDANTSDGQFEDDNKDPDLNSITNIITVEEAKTLQTESSYNGRSAYGVLHGFISHFDVDGVEKLCVRNVCHACHKTVYESNGFVCGNKACSGGDAPSFENQVDYNISVNLSDHTGTIEHCYLRANVAEQLLGCKAQEFINRALPERTGMKWVHLLEKTKAVIKIKHGKGNKSFVSIMDLERLVKTDSEIFN